MISEVLEFFFLLLTAIMMAYLVRHYIFTITVLREANKNKKNSVVEASMFEPTVTILIPAHNEEKVIGRLLQRITELTYPKARAAKENLQL